MFGFQTRKTLSVRPSSSEIEFQDVLFDTLAGNDEKGGFENRMLEPPLSRALSKGLLWSFCALAGFFLLYAFYLQVVSHATFSAMAQQNSIRRLPLLSNRGIIYDQTMKQLAFNEPSFDVLCDQRDFPRQRAQREEAFGAIADVLQISYDDVVSRFNGSAQAEVLLQENLSHDQLIVIETSKGLLQGCRTQEGTTRVYKDPETLAHLLGYTAKISSQELARLAGYYVQDQIGKDGIEKTYEEILRGDPGAFVERRNAQGVVTDRFTEESKRQGGNLVLWTDEELARQMKTALERVFRQTGASKGAIVALQPKTGGVLGLISAPSFDTNALSKGITQKEWSALADNSSHPLFNRVIGGVGFPTGSVIKPIVALAALEEGVINEHTTLYAPLELCVKNMYGGSDNCFRDWTFHGMTDIRRAIAESVNTFFYMIGGGFEKFKGLGATKIKAYLERFGWGSATNIDLPGEGAGKLPDINQNWRLGDTYHFSIGQGSLSATPLQVASAFVAIANGGTLFEPRVVKAILKPDKTIEKLMEPTIRSSTVADPALLSVIREGMRQTVTAGSATGWLDSLPVSVAAKTGTAQTGRVDAAGKDYLYSWTVSFAPYENPEIVLVAVVENIHEGQVASLPITKDLLSWYFTRR